MSTSVESQELRVARELPLLKPLNEAVWQAWVAKGRIHDRRRSAARMKAVKWASIAALIVVAGLLVLLYNNPMASVFGFAWRPV